MTMKTRPPYRRMLEIDRLLRTNRYPNATTFSQRFEVSPRTVHRDIEYMRDQLKAPIEFDKKRNGYFYTEKNYSLPAVSLTQGDLFALCIATKVLRQYKGTGYEKELTSAFQKIAKALPEEITIDLSDLEQSYTFELGPTKTIDANLFKDLSKAVTESLQLKITYYTQSRDTTTQRAIDPYHLANIRGDWYLIAFCHKNKALRMFSPDRIKSHRFTGKRFVKLEDFDLQKYLSKSFGVEIGGKVEEVKLKFDSYQGKWIKERVWHPSQTIQNFPDGSLVLTLKVSIQEELIRWILSYGEHCQVLKPKRLKAQIKRIVQKMSKFYEK